METFTLGVEEEYMVIDPHTRELTSHDQKIVELAAHVIKDSVKAEMHQAVVEVGTDICADVDEAFMDVGTLRKTISGIADELGLWIGASGTHPFSHWEKQLITEHIRYSEIVNELQEAARSNLIFGLHVHVGMETREMAIHIANSARYFLPHIFALSTNSPFWEGRQTGYKSFRTKVFEKFGIKFKYVDTTNPENISQAISDKTKLIWIETPTNPLMNITDIAEVSVIARKAGAILCVDNTFASPYLQNPLDLGADIVMHSSTKYLGGHSDVIQGALVMNDESLRDQLYFIQKSCGAVPGPLDCFLVLRGIKTLHVRMKQHNENGYVIAHFLRNHPKVDKVYWCGFVDHPNHHIAKIQMKGFGGMMSFTLKDDSMEAANKVLSSTQLFSLAESLGGVESLINHPASMTHASIPREERIKNGLSDGLIRLSIGIEDADDLVEDLKQAIG